MNADVRVQVEGLLPERLLQRALERGAVFATARRIGPRTLLVETDRRGARILLELCRRFSLPARVVERRGGAALLDDLRSRPTLAVGLAVFAALCGMLLSRVWRVDIAFTGEAAALGDRRAIEQALAARGVRPGISRRLDTGLLSQQLSAAAEGCSFVSARLQGVRLLVEAAPEAPAPQVYDVEYARDLFCAVDGVVVSARADSGALCVKPGDTVRRGQVLIRGEEMLSGDETRPIGALGEVIVRTWITGAAEIPLTRSVARRTGRGASRSSLRLPWLKWPITGCADFSKQEIETERLAIGGMFLPVEIARETLWETRQIEEPLPEEDAKARAAALAMADASARLSLDGPEKFEITRTWLRYERERERTLRCQAVYEITTNAAATRDILANGSRGRATK